jgi:hypothetical protein
MFLEIRYVKNQAFHTVDDYMIKKEKEKEKPSV